MKDLGLKRYTPEYFLPLTKEEIEVVQSILLDKTISIMEGSCTPWERQMNDHITSIMCAIITVKGEWKKADYNEMEENDNAEKI